MAPQSLRVGFVLLLLAAAGCTRKPVPIPPAAPAPPPPRQNLFVLLPDPEGKPGGITVTNPVGAQSLSQPYQAVRVERSDVAPTAPFAMDEAEVRRVFGAALDVLPAPEIAFTLYFGEGSDVLLPESSAQLPAILNAIRERRSTAISVIGHTDTTADPQFNYELGLRRARGVANTIRELGVDASDLFVESHGEADPIVKTGRGVAERRNRRVEVIAR